MFIAIAYFALYLTNINILNIKCALKWISTCDGSLVSTIIAAATVT